MDWSLCETNAEQLAFTRKVTKLRRKHPVFRRRRFFAGEPPQDGQPADIAWFTPSGATMSSEDWHNHHARSMLVFLNGEAIPEPNQRGEKVVGDSFLVAFNGHYEPLTFTLPDEVYGEGWLVALDTHDDQAGSVSIFDDATTLLPGVEFRVADRSIVVLRRPRS
jgi:glycogen operon protein